MNRRQFLQTTVAASALSTFNFHSSGQQKSGQRSIARY
jgi:hypothetical protein